MREEWSSFWWDQITGASMLVSAVSGALLQGQMVLLVVPEDLPWRQQMRSIIEHSYREDSPSRDILVESIDDEREYPDGGDVGRLLLDRCAETKLRLGYRPMGGRRIQDYICRHGILRNRVIWVKGLTRARAKEWMAFCQDYGTRGVQDGLFVLEVHERGGWPMSVRGKVVDYGACVSSYDVRLFNSFLLGSQEQIPASWRDYVASVCAQLCGTDAEVSGELIERTDFLRQTPQEGLARIAEDPFFARRGERDSRHILSLVRRGEEEKIGHRVWTAQVQTLFPLIEMERCRIIDQLYPRLERALEDVDLFQYGDRITDPEDMELGTLVCLMAIREEEGSDQYVLFLPEEEIRERVHFLHHCRNQIAHAKVLTPQEIGQLMGSTQNDSRR